MKCALCLREMDPNKPAVALPPDNRRVHPGCAEVEDPTFGPQNPAAIVAGNAAQAEAVDRER